MTVSAAGSSRRGSKQHRWTPEETNTIRNMAEAGKPPTEMVERLPHLTPNMISNKLYNLKKRGKVKPRLSGGMLAGERKCRVVAYMLDC